MTLMTHGYIYIYVVYKKNNNHEILRVMNVTSSIIKSRAAASLVKTHEK